MVSEACSDTYVTVGVDVECADEEVFNPDDFVADRTFVSDVAAKHKKKKNSKQF